VDYWNLNNLEWLESFDLLMFDLLVSTATSIYHTNQLSAKVVSVARSFEMVRFISLLLLVWWGYCHNSAVEAFVGPLPRAPPARVFDNSTTLFAYSTTGGVDNDDGRFD
jgi:hypothetical protein